MARNPHVDWFTRDEEQNLLYDLVAEATAFAGHDVYYCPRTVENRDSIFSEGEWHEFNDAFIVDCYIKTTSSMGGEGAMLSKFGVEVREDLVVTLSMKSFRAEVLSEHPEYQRPREGDTIFIPMIGQLFTVKYVDKQAFFYQLGGLQAWDLSLELYEGSSAKFDTGVPEIDAIYQPITHDLIETGIYDTAGYLLTDEDGWFLELNEVVDRESYEQNVEFENEGRDVIDWSEANPFSVGEKY